MAGREQHAPVAEQTQQSYERQAENQPSSNYAPMPVSVPRQSGTSRLHAGMVKGKKTPKTIGSGVPAADLSPETNSWRKSMERQCA
jgi:hypothetical protein